jgi:hypothetical protein
MPTRRSFLAGLAGVTAAAVTRGADQLLAADAAPTSKPMTDQTIFTPDGLRGSLAKDDAPSALSGGQWYIAHKPGDALRYTFPAGSLGGGGGYLTCDLLTEGFFLTIYQLELQEGEHGPRFTFNFATLPECQARLRMPLSAVSQNRWLFDREGALIKPMAGGDRVELSRVDRMTLQVLRKVEEPVRWCMTPLRLTKEEPPRLDDPLLPKGALADEMGQTALRDWPGKSRSTDEVTARLKSQLAAAGDTKWPANYSRYGGRADAPTTLPTATKAAAGFFRTHNDGKRWWLVDPDGKPFWSSGVDCVLPSAEAKIDGIEKALTWAPDPSGEFAQAIGSGRGGHAGRQIDYLAANLIRAFGAKDWMQHWTSVAYAHLRQFGFNTVGNWSVWQFSRIMKFPYVRPLQFRPALVRNVFRDFPDVFDPKFETDAREYANQLQETATDPLLIGYFLMNEPTWGFAKDSIAAGMLFNTDTCACREALAMHLRANYRDDAALASGWRMPGVSFDKLVRGRWSGALSEPAVADLKEFSTVMVERLFRTMTDACRRVDPNHLNLGARYFTVPPDWALAGMKRFDGFSFNCYRDHVPADELEKITKVTGRPVLIGEWHFGALDVGLPASGIGRVADQAERGKAFRFYVEQAAAIPQCVGVHYFILYDQPALGRFDGECYNIGFLDICSKPYEPLARAARETHERLYAVAAGETPPFADAPKYLPKIFC